MTKKLICRLTILVAALCLVGPFNAFAETKTIIQTVKQPFGGSQSPDDARVAATAKAKREALEQAGTYIESLTIVKNHAIEKDQILALAAGVLKTEIVSQKNYATDDAFGIEVIAKIVVDTGILEDRVRKLLEDRKLLDKYQEVRKREADLLAQIDVLKTKIENLKNASEEQKETLKAKMQATVNALSAVNWYNKALDLRSHEAFTKDVTEEAIGYLYTAVNLDPQYSDAFSLLGRVYYDKGEYNRAIEFSQKALEIRLKHLGPDHPDVAASYNNVGGVYGNKGNYDRSIEYSKKALQIQLKTLGQNHPDLATTYVFLGVAYRGKGKYDTAIKYFQKALEIDLRALGQDHPYVADSYGNIGLTYQYKGNHNRAIQYYQKALAIELESVGYNHPNVAATYNNLGGAYNQKGDYERAIAYYRKALEIKLKVQDRNHPSIAVSYNNLGEVCREKTDYDQAIEHYQKALDIYLKNFGQNHPDVATTYVLLGAAYQGKKKHSRAVEHFRKALEIFKATLGEGHPTTQAIKNNIDFLESE